MSNGYDTCVQKYSGTQHVFTARSKNDTITLKAGNGESLYVDGTLESSRPPRMPLTYEYVLDSVTRTSEFNITAGQISLTSPGPVIIYNTVNSTSVTTGALIVSGGLGVVGALNVGGTLVAGVLTASNIYTSTLNTGSTSVTSLSVTNGSTIGSMTCSNSYLNTLSVSGSFTAGNMSIGSATASVLSVTSFYPLYNYNYEYATCIASSAASQVITTGTDTIISCYNSASVTKASYLPSGLTTPSLSTVVNTSLGIFLCTAQISFTAAAAYSAQLSITTNGSNLVARTTTTTYNGTVYMSCSGLAFLNAATTFRTHFKHAKGSDLTIQAAGSDSFVFNVVRVSDIPV